MTLLRLTLLTALAPIAWGTTYLVTTELLPAGHPLLAALLRSLPTGVLAVAIGCALPRGSWWPRAALLGILNIGAFFPLLFVAAERLPGGVAAAVGGLQPLIIIGLGLLVLGERTRPLAVLAALVGAGGVALVVLGPALVQDGGGFDATGVAAAIGAVAATGVGMVLTKRWGLPTSVRPVAYAGWQLTAGGIFLLPLTLLLEPLPARVDVPAVAGYLWLGTVGGLIAYALWFRGIQRLPVAVPGMLALLSPIVATLLGVLVAGETFTILQLIGVVVVLASLSVGPVFARRRRPEALIDADDAPVAVRG